ncbi:MAG TPA: YebC/PmpR family DNA-binding transcriptional regulator, partial [Tenuifilaceae bacterium]|nr:YebC/PmpR family DNA-binding transcriptional regulator [Tenuifilaceae bacterium]
DFGVEEVFAEENNMMIFAEFTQFGPIQRFLEEKGLNILNFQFERIPNDTKQLTAEQQAEVEKLIEKIEEDEDVTNVFHNMVVE